MKLIEKSHTEIFFIESWEYFRELRDFYFWLDPGVEVSKEYLTMLIIEYVLNGEVNSSLVDQLKDNAVAVSAALYSDFVDDFLVAFPALLRPIKKILHERYTYLLHESYLLETLKLLPTTDTIVLRLRTHEPQGHSPKHFRPLDPTRVHRRYVY